MFSRSPDSRKSASCGRLSARIARLRLSCTSASTGYSELARDVLQSASSGTDVPLADYVRHPPRSLEELDVVDHDEGRWCALGRLHLQRVGAYVARCVPGAKHDVQLRAGKAAQLPGARRPIPRSVSVPVTNRSFLTFVITDTMRTARSTSLSSILTNTTGP